MKIVLDSTTKIVDLIIGGVPVPARVWEGVSEKGAPCIAFITRIGVKDGDDMAEFDRDLEQARTPTPDVAALPGRLVL